MTNTNCETSMQTVDLHHEIILKLEELLPQEQNKVEYLSELLGVSQNSAYRRLVATTQFTLAEALLIAADLGFSLDNLLTGQSFKNKALFEIQDFDENTSASMGLQKMQQYISIFGDAENASQTEYVLATNSLPIGLAVKSDLLYKFTLYKWLYAMGEISSFLEFSAFELSEELKKAQQEYNKVYSSCKKGTLIIDEFFLSSMVSRIQFFHAKDLITDQEKSMLQEDLLKSVSNLEKAATKGSYEDGVFLDIYISMLKIDTTYLYTLFDNTSYSFFMGYSSSLFKTQDADISDLQKKWLKSTMRYSSSITLSNEVRRYRYFNKQRELIRSLNQTSGLALI